MYTSYSYPPFICMYLYVSTDTYQNGVPTKEFAGHDSLADPKSAKR